MTDAVLIVDDSLTVRMDLAEAFESGGFEPVLCASAAEARAALARRSVAVIVLDVVLPDTDGIELMRHIRELPANGRVPILLLSSEAEVRDRIRGLQKGADDYVGKPYDAGYVVARARELTRLTERRDRAPRGDGAPRRRQHDLPRRAPAALEGAGYEVSTAATGEEGLRMAAALLPSAVARRQRPPRDRRQHRDSQDAPRRGAARDAVPPAHRLGGRPGGAAGPRRRGRRLLAQGRGRRGDPGAPRGALARARGAAAGRDGALGAQARDGGRRQPDVSPGAGVDPPGRGLRRGPGTLRRGGGGHAGGPVGRLHSHGRRDAGVGRSRDVPAHQSVAGGARHRRSFC